MKLFKAEVMSLGDSYFYLIVSENKENAGMKALNDRLIYTSCSDIHSNEEVNEIDGYAVIIENKKIILKEKDR